MKGRAAEDVHGRLCIKSIWNTELNSLMKKYLEYRIKFFAEKV